ncbi:MAG: hypothetical protein LVS60_18645 [Nodosilinea sp. LVE1205-7]|jgi:hypothetical protein
MRERIFQAVNWILMVNLVFVLVCFGWFLLAVLGQSMNLNLGLRLWYDLWNPLILPAISLLMAGAIASGVLEWLSRRFPRQST